MTGLDIFEALRPDTDPFDTATARRVRDRILAAHPELTDGPNGDVTPGQPAGVPPATVRSATGQPSTARTASAPPAIARRARTTPAEWTEEPDARRPRGMRIVALAGAAAAAVIGLVAIATVRGQDPVDESPATATEPAPDAQAPAPPATGDDLAEATGFLLPTTMPEGVEITSLEAGPDVAQWGNPFGETRWARLEADGTVSGVFSVRPPRPADAPEGTDDDYDETVRGVPASVFTQEDNISIGWYEAGAQMAARSQGLTRHELLAAVEALEIDVEALSVTLPDGGSSVGLVHESELGFSDDHAIVSTVTVGELDNPARAALLYAAATPNTFGRTLTDIAEREEGWEPRTMEGVDALVRTNAVSGPNGTMTEMTWIADGFRFRVYGSFGPEAVFAFAAGLELTDFTTFSAAESDLGDRMTTMMTSWAVLDRATFTDGIEVTVRSRRTGSGADAICIEAPVQQCMEQVSEASLVDGYADNVFSTFDVNGRQVMIGWQSAGEADRLGEPTLSAGTAANPADGLSLTTTATIDQFVVGEAGRFLEIRIPAGERPPALSFLSGDDVLSHLSPT